MKKILLAAFILCFACSDQTDCTTALPAPIHFFLEFQDTNGNTLIGDVYLQDSFKLSSPNAIQYLKPAIGFGASHRLSIFYGDLESGEDYYLELDQTDTDTLQLEHQLNVQPCFSLPLLQKFIYNQDILFDIEISSPSETFIIIKED